MKRIICLVLCLGLAACMASRQMYRDVETSAQDNQKEIDIAKEDFSHRQKVVFDEPGMYVSTQKRSLERKEKWMYRNIALYGNQLPFSMLVSRILADTPAFASYQKGMDTQTRLSLRFSGTVEQALDQLAAQSHYSYKVANNRVAWTDFISKTFDISFMPGKSNYTLGGKASGTTNKGAGDDTIEIGKLDEAGQFSSLQGNLSIWDDLKNTLTKLKSKEGVVQISEATTTVTVRDHTQNVREIEKYIQDLNAKMAKQVSVKVRLVEVELNKNYNHGIDWNLVASMVAGKAILKGNLSQPLALEPIASATSPGITFKNIGGGQDADANTVLFSALGKQGKLSVITEPQVTIMNNQVGSVNISQQRAYLAKMESKVQGSGDDKVVSNSLTPGVINSGFNLYLLPKIQDDRVFLQISSTLSDLDKISEVSVGDTKIQTPELSGKRFNQRSVVKSGSTLILAGFKKVSNQNAEQSLYDVTLLGGRGASVIQKEVLVLITPVIIRDMA